MSGIRWHEKSYEERVRELQRRLGHPQTGQYTQKDRDEVWKLPRIVSEIVERYFGVRGIPPHSMAHMARLYGVGPQIISETMQQAFGFFDLVRETNEIRDFLLEDSHRREAELRSEAILTRKERSSLMRARSEINRVLKTDEEKRTAQN